jgi:heme/copper-type cytochrome/quinol oxidase subunit 2
MINRVGYYFGQCSEICGVNHGFMPIGIYGFYYWDFLSNLSIKKNIDVETLLSCLHSLSQTIEAE